MPPTIQSVLTLASDRSVFSENRGSKVPPALMPSMTTDRVGAGVRASGIRRRPPDWTAWIGIARDANPAIGASLTGYSYDEVFVRVQSLATATKGSDTAIDPRLAEFFGRWLASTGSRASHPQPSPMMTWRMSASRLRAPPWRIIREQVR